MMYAKLRHPPAAKPWAPLTYLAHSAHTHPARNMPRNQGSATPNIDFLPITQQTVCLEFVASTACGTPASA